MKHHILWFTENYFPRRGGMAQSCDRIVWHLRQAGIAIDVIHLTSEGTTYTTEAIGGVDVVCPLGNGETLDEAHALNMLRLQLVKLHARQPFTHVAAFGGSAAMLAAPVFAAWFDAALLVLLRGNDFDTGIFSLKKADFLHRALERAAAVCCVSSDKVQKVQKLYPNTAAFYTPNGIDLKNWQPLPSDRAQAAHLRSEHTNNAQHVFGLFGQLKAKKGVIFFLEQLQASLYADTCFVFIIGDVSDELHQWLEATSPRFGYQLLPFAERYDLIPYYLACDAVAIPSFYDGMPNVLLEAGALAVPVIAADTDGMHDVLHKVAANWLFAPADSADCQHALTLFCEMPPEKRLHIAQELQAHIQMYHSAEAERERYMTVLANNYHV